MDNANVFYSSEIEYQNIKDEDLIKMIRSSNKSALEHLINRYKNLVNMKVSKYYMVGAEREDIVQEGLIGLFKAIKDYQFEKENSFRTFANVCIERQLITAIKTSNRQKHMPLNSYLSLNMNAYDNEEENSNDADLMEIFNSNLVEDPLDTITKKEYYQTVENAIDKSLSNFEKQVLSHYMQGESYVQIAEKLDTPVKSVDNAIQRIRKKAIKEMPNDMN
ncbi:MAG: RNA polymerase sporulation sigma factor SigH [Clostridia bacterium]|nr:RNA polymerase sporulation sigma factor SigH [Clostridia bacterium]